METKRKRRVPAIHWLVHVEQRLCAKEITPHDTTQSKAMSASVFLSPHVPQKT